MNRHICILGLAACMAAALLPSAMQRAALAVPLEVSITALPAFLPVSTAKEPPERVRLPLAPVFQYPELPNGCEIVSLAAALQYFGYDADKVTLATDFLQCVPLTSSRWYGYFGPDPNEAYAGDPASAWYGYYCFAAPIVEAANSYLGGEKMPATAEDVSGADEDALIAYLCEGQPVIVWATLNLHEPYRSGFQWILPNGSVYTPFSNLHCMVLTGFDENYFYLCDPIFGKRTVERALFMDRYEKIGSYAVVLNGAQSLSTGVFY